eukprot:GSMAST32.ASY1.ANO1.1052.1 assembled CDS
MRRVLSTISLLLVDVVFITYPPYFVHACFLAGSDTGECLEREKFVDYTPFCADKLQYTACVPRYNENFANHTIVSKDNWIKKTYQKVIETRILVENDDGLRDNDMNEHGIDGATVIRFHENKDCQNAYKNYICWLNFPRCDSEDRSLIMCRSACENYKRACGYGRDMWRCGPEKWQNGMDGPEEASGQDDEGYPMFLRDFFPGHPFRDNIIREDEDGDDIEIVVCTPSLKNAVLYLVPEVYLILLLWILYLFL